LKPLRDHRITQVACGEHHSLALTGGDIYAWGKGFEGQLGLGNSIEIASTPQYVKAFYNCKKKVRTEIKYICCGSNYSLAVTT
jgi:alpha-tubulin suppressor-like RCC1 family protein